MVPKLKSARSGLEQGCCGNAALFLAMERNRVSSQCCGSLSLIPCAYHALPKQL